MEVAYELHACTDQPAHTKTCATQCLQQAARTLEQQLDAVLDPPKELDEAQAQEERKSLELQVGNGCRCAFSSKLAALSPKHTVCEARRGTAKYARRSVVQF
jgi:hypothetical protein